MESLLCVIFVAVRTIKFDFLPSGSVYARYAWYLYYVPADTCGTMDVFCSFIYWKTVSLSIRAKVENTLHSGVHFDRRNYD